jgi:hypothetical protein
MQLRERAVCPDVGDQQPRRVRPDVDNGHAHVEARLAAEQR